MVAEAVTTLGLSLEIATRMYPGSGCCCRCPCRALKQRTSACSAVPLQVASQNGPVLDQLSCPADLHRPLAPSQPAAQFVLLAGAGTLAKSMAKGMGRPCFRVIQTHFSGRPAVLGLSLPRSCVVINRVGEVAWPPL